MIGNNDDLVAVPNFCMGPKFPFEYADSAGPTNVVRHENVRFDPDILAGLDTGFASRASQDFFC